MNDTVGRTALVLGASGGIGGVVAETLAGRGWKVRGMARDPRAGTRDGHPAGIQWVAGDAMVRDDVVRAANGVAVIVHAVNPPGYRNWGRLVLPMIENTIAGARAAGGARILLPGTIYNFDPSTTPVLDETSPQKPRSRKGAIRVELEKRLEVASSNTPALVVRAGDFFGPRSRASWFAQAMVRPGSPVTRLVNLARGVGHSWAFLPDLAEAMVRLLEAPEHLRPFERVQFEGFWDPDGSQMLAAVREAVGSNRIAERAFPWWLMHLLAPFGGFPREAADIAPIWRYPVHLDNRRLQELIGPEPRTPIVQAIRSTLIGMGCMPEPGVLLPASSV